ncbi:MAG TPA: hypothetical protein H9823_09615 [Candidatus Rubneribacter avistercoris]|nr:hypothetical protein [Candidatus Rubneribacter avistercoris]
MMGGLRKSAPAACAAVAACAVAAALCLLLAVLAPLPGTAAFTSATANSEPNAFTLGSVKIRLVENDVPAEGAEADVPFGEDAKKVQVECIGRNPAVVRAYLYPDVAETDGTRMWAAQDWSEPQDGRMSLGPVTLHLAQGWEQSWTYRDGAFYYRKVLQPGQTTEPLLAGVTLADGVDAAALGGVGVAVAAEAVQASPSEAPATWGCTVGDDGSVEVG